MSGPRCDLHSRKDDPLGDARSLGPAARHRLGRPHGPDLERGHRRGSLAPFVPRRPGQLGRISQRRNPSLDGLERRDDPDLECRATAGPAAAAGSLMHLRCAWPGSVRTADAVVSGGFDGTVWLWDAETGRRWAGQSGWARSSSAWHSVPTGGKSPSGAATAMRQSGRSPIEASGWSASCAHRSTVRDVAFSPDGNRLVTASHDGTARVWDVQTGSPVTPELKHGRWVFHAEFSPDGGRVVTASHDGTARVWNAQTGRPITPALGPMRHSIAVRDACFSPDGGRVATAGFDGMARIWDAATGEPLSPPLYHGGALQRARFTPDGSQRVDRRLRLDRPALECDDRRQLGRDR